MAITIVSGLPRSGTSMMMQMLAAGGIPVLCDKEHKADTDNPRGYFEWEPVKQLGAHPELIAEAEGKAVKVFSALISFLPPDYEYRVIFMHRPLLEVLKSQGELLRRSGKQDSEASNSAVTDAFKWHLTAVDDWQASRANMRVLRADYHSVLREPLVAAREIAVFLGQELNIEAMAQQVDRSLYCIRLEPAV